MSCHIIWLHMKYPELFMGVRARHPSTSQWTERVVLCFFCPAGGGRVPWSKVWRCRGMFKQTGRNIQLGSQTVALDISWSIIGFSDYHGMIITFPSITGSSTKENILDQVVFVSETVQHGYETTCQGADQGEADVELLGWEDSRMGISWYFLGISHVK